MNNFTITTFNKAITVTFHNFNNFHNFSILDQLPEYLESMLGKMAKEMPGLVQKEESEVNLKIVSIKY